MAEEQSPICPNTYVTNEGEVVACMCYMIEYPYNLGYLKCSCGYAVKIVKRTIYIVGGD